MKVKSKVKKIAGITGLLFATTFLGGCVQPYKHYVRQVAKEKGFTQEQAEVIYHGVLIKEMMEEKEDGNREIKYDWASNTDVLDKIDEMKGDLNNILNSKETKIIKMLEGFPGMKESIEKNGRIVKFMEDIVKTHYLKNKFDALVNSNYMYDPNEDKFDVKIFAPGAENLEEKLKFITTSVEEAKNLGDLKSIEDFNIAFDYKQKEQDPKHPYDTNKVIYKDKRLALSIKVFDLNGDNIGDYLELYRVKEDGTAESKPALKIFTSIDSNVLNVMVLDKDNEDSTIGYGIPDDVDKIWGLTNDQLARQIFEHSFLLRQILSHDKKKETVDSQGNQIFITKAGEVTIPEYEMSQDPKGWKIPLEYKNHMRTNYTLEVMLDTENESPGLGKKIKYIAKKWHSPLSEYLPVRGKVVEYYEVKDEFKDKKVINATIDGKKITMDILDEETKTAYDSYFLEKNPVAIDYTVGNYRFRIIDLDDKTGYEARKKIADNDGKATLNREVDNPSTTQGPVYDDFDPVGE